MPARVAVAPQSHSGKGCSGRLTMENENTADPAVFSRSPRQPPIPRREPGTIHIKPCPQEMENQDGTLRKNECARCDDGRDDRSVRRYFQASVPDLEASTSARPSKPDQNSCRSRCAGTKTSCRIEPCSDPSKRCPIVIPEGG